MVELVTHTGRPDMVVYIAARRCASGKTYEALVREYEEISHTDCAKFLEKLLAKGHHSVFEHVSFTYHIDQISRACSHQLVRHRLMSVSQQSQRHVQPDAYVAIPGLSEPQRKLYESMMGQAKELYDELVRKGVPQEDARLVLPQSACTSMIVTVNARELMHMAEERLCRQAQWEVREVVKAMCLHAVRMWPLLAGYLGPKCLRLTYCPENAAGCKDFGKAVRELS